jgi:hypothetical protein
LCLILKHLLQTKLSLMQTLARRIESPPEGRYLDILRGTMSEQRIGDIRVSTLDQHTERQLDGIDLDERFYYYQLGRFESGVA